MSDLSVDLDLLAIHLKNKIEEEELSVRGAAVKIGLGAATLSRLLSGTKSETVPDTANISKAAAWVGMTVGDVAARSQQGGPSSIADVEVQLRALPGLEKPDVEALVAMVKAGYEHAKSVRKKKSS